MFGLRGAASLFSQRERMILDAAAAVLRVGPVKWRRRQAEFVRRGTLVRVDAALIRRTLASFVRADTTAGVLALSELLAVAPPTEPLADERRLRPLLRPRLLHPRELTGPRRAMCRREVFGGLLHAIAIGPGPNAPLVTTAILDRWGIEFEELAIRAAGNLRRRIKPEHLLKIEGSAGLMALMHDEEQASAAALILDQIIPNRMRRHGIVFAAPTADALLLLPVVEGGGADGLAAMVQSCFSMARDCDEPLSEQVFWLRGGEVRVLPMTAVEDRRSRRIHIEARGVLEELLRVLGVVE